MTQAKTKISVKFLYHRRNNDLFAFFPNDIEISPNIKMCYSHVGQHSSCHINYANESEPASEVQYFLLEQELKSIGYELNILK